MYKDFRDYLVRYKAYYYYRYYFPKTFFMVLCPLQDSNIGYIMTI